MQSRKIVFVARACNIRVVQWKHFTPMTNAVI